MSREITSRLNPTTPVSDVFRSDSGVQRLSTFDQAWSGAVAKTELANAGFSYTGIGDKVECGQCGLKLLNWTSTDDPLHEHATRRPLCPFINSRYRQLGQRKPPKHPQYQQLQARLDSFVAWPGRYVPKTPEELAAAGFFYIGSADRVTCFQCGITLRDWEEEHDPVTEHQRYSENCQFINKTDIKELGVTERATNAEVNNSYSNESEGACSAQTLDIDNAHCLIGCQQVENVQSKEYENPKPNNPQSSGITTTTTTTTLSSIMSQTTESPTTTSKTSLGRMDVFNPSTNGRLAEENKRLKEKGTCRVCRKKRVSILFLPCGHLVTCSDCAPKVSDCVVCRKTILGTVKTYFT